MITRRIVVAIIKRATTTTTPIVRVEDIEPCLPPEPTVVRVVEGVFIVGEPDVPIYKGSV